MKNFNISNKSKFTFLKFWKGWNLLDGQRRREVIFRRAFVLIVGSLLLYLFLLAVVGKKEQNVPEVQAKEIAKVVVEQEKEEWVDGAKVTTKANGTVEVVPAEVFMESPVIAVKQFVDNYAGARIDNDYFSMLEKTCNDTQTLKLVIAVSVAETSMGKATTNNSNYWGYYKGGDRKYDPTREQMAKDICGAFNGYYKDVTTNKAKANRYVGYDSTNWLKNVNWALSQMK